MGPAISEALWDALKVTGLVFVMMVTVDLLTVAGKGRYKTRVQGGRWRQYLIASALGATPGCLGAFANVSLYVHGGITLGAMVAGTIATSGDEAFVMLSMIPKQAVLLFLLLLGCGVVSGRLADWIAGLLKIRTRGPCPMDGYHPGEGTGTHYLKLHIWKHIARSHLWRVFLWSFGTLVALRVGLGNLDLRDFIGNHALWMLLLAALVAVVPESGPHMVFVVLYARGVVPFSVLFTSSFVQDGHGLLPLLSFSVRDAALIKAFNLGLGLCAGGVLYTLGL